MLAPHVFDSVSVRDGNVTLYGLRYTFLSSPSAVRRCVSPASVFIITYYTDSVYQRVSFVLLKSRIV